MVLCSWAGKLSGPWGDAALRGEAGDLGKLKVEGMASTAVCLLLMSSILFFSPSSGAADTSEISCSSETLPSPGQSAW